MSNKQKKVKKEKKGLFSYIHLWSLIFFGIGIFAFAMYMIAKRNIGLADFISQTFGRVTRWVLATVTSAFPLSMAEMLLWFSPVLCVVVAVLALRCVRRSWKSFSRFISGILAIASLVYSVFVFSVGSAHYGTRIADKMGIERRDVSAQELYDTASVLLDTIIEQLDEVVYPEGTYSKMPYSYEEMNKKLNESFAIVRAQYNGIDNITSRTKPVILSPYWTYTHISGMYTFFTGEANVNTNYPDFVMASSAAHEMAHQRGVVSEDEANFIAFVVCYTSDDPFLRYAGCMDVYQDVSSSLASASPELYAKLSAKVPAEVRGEFKAYSEFFDKYRENVAADISNTVNNAYIENHNQPAGIKSYGMVVDLVVSYLLYED